MLQAMTSLGGRLAFKLHYCPVIAGYQYRAHPLLGLGLDYSPPSRQEYPILPLMFSELCCVTTPFLLSSLLARRRKFSLLLCGWFSLSAKKDIAASLSIGIGFCVGVAGTAAKSTAVIRRWLT
jgi:hypothetical protein